VISPAGYKRNARRITWDWRHLNPKQDIQITWFPGFVNIEVNGRRPYRLESGADIEAFAFELPGHQIEFAPRELGNDIWMPAQPAASLIDAMFSVQKPGRVVRITHGGQWVQASVGSRRLTRSDGKVFVMSRAASNQHSRNDSTASMTMIELGPLVRAFGGTAAFNSAGDRYVVTLPNNGPPRP
jgi:hypothetical protein